VETYAVHTERAAVLRWSLVLYCVITVLCCIPLALFFLSFFFFEKQNQVLYRIILQHETETATSNHVTMGCGGLSIYGSEKVTQDEMQT
jgi:hypothetical protein